MNTKSFFAMNIYKTAAMLLTVTLSVAFTACSDDDGIEKKVVSEMEKVNRIDIVSYDDLKAFQNTIVETNDLGVVTSYIYGEPIDSKDPEHLYIGVENIHEAKEMFDLWFVNDVVTSPTSNGGLAVLLTSREGKPQGTVFFCPGTEENHVAEVTMSPKTQLKGFRQITFLKNSAWPKKNLLKAGQKYYKFDIVKNIKMKDIQDCLYSNDKALNFVCIQGSSNGVKPIFCAVSNCTAQANAAHPRHLTFRRYCRPTGTLSWRSSRRQDADRSSKDQTTGTTRHTSHSSSSITVLSTIIADTPTAKRTAVRSTASSTESSDITTARFTTAQVCDKGSFSRSAFKSAPFRVERKVIGSFSRLKPL